MYIDIYIYIYIYICFLRYISVLSIFAICNFYIRQEHIKSNGRML
jgi:hypothetical protein